MRIRLVHLLFLLTISFPVMAYLGPGMGGGFLAAIFGFFLAIFLALWGILYFPIKRAIQNRKKKIQAKNES